MKKILSILVGGALILGILPYSTANAASRTSDAPIYANMKSREMDYVSFGKKVIESYYKNRDLGVATDLSKEAVPEVTTFLSAKADVKQYSTKMHKNYKTNYNIVVNLLESKILENKVYLKFQVDISFNYTDLLNVQSGERTMIEMVVDSKNNKIIDMYDPNDYFDNSIRGTGLNILDDSKKIGLLDIDAAKRKREESLAVINDEYAQEKSKVTESYALADSSGTTLAAVTTPITTLATRYNLTKGNIVSYARNNYYKATPASGNGIVPYYDFSQIPNAWDCTNFVSHALLAGGATVYDTGSSGITSTGWYFRSTANRSSSWSGVQNLYDFITTNTTKGPGGSSMPYSTRPGDFQEGDIIQFHNGSIWRHSTIVTGKYAIDDRVGALVTGRSSSSANNNNMKATDVYPGNAKRIIYAYNYK